MSPARELERSYWTKDASEPVLELTLGDLLRRVAAEVPDRTALVEGSADAGGRRRWSYRSLLEVVEKVAHVLAARFQPGERIAIWAPNCPEWILLQHGAALAGLVLVPVNPAFLAEELRHVLQTSRAVAIFFVASWRNNDLASILESIRPDVPSLRDAVSLDDWDTFVGGPDIGISLPATTPDDMLQIQYTSGTTGFPKGACLHHRGIVNASRFVARRAGFADGGVWVNAMPLFHVGGCGVAAVGALALRGTLVLMPGFDAASMLEVLESEQGTATLLVPTMLVAMLDHPDRVRRNLSNLQTILSGAAPVPAALVRRATEAFGCRLSILFGQTELNGVITQTALGDPEDLLFTTVGRPLPQMELKIADPLTGEALPLDTPGEICARGYQTMKGYLQITDDASTKALRADGWLHTGDLGTMDRHGYVRITGRLKEMIIRGGENIYPGEIERLLLDHPDVAQACVLGLPDEKWGEVVVAVLRLAAQASAVTAQQMHAYCRANLAAYKTPTVWYFVDEWPLTASGKVVRHLLRSQLMEGRHQGVVVAHTSRSPREA